MKLLYSIFFFLFVIQLTNAQCFREAPFQDGPDYSLNGTATLSFLSNGTKTLSFDSSFATSSGPDLHVYLSESATVSTPGGVLETPNTIDLGLLISPSGSQSYDLTSVSPAVDLDSYNYVIIHCKDFNHLWGTGTFGLQEGADCGSLSVENIDVETIKMYPTLIKDNQFFIQQNESKKISVNFFSIVGESLHRTLTLEKEFSILDVSFLQKGIYIVQVKRAAKIRTQKIIIQ